MRKRSVILALIASLIGVAALFKGYYASASDWERYKGSVAFYEVSANIHSELGSLSSLDYPEAPNVPTKMEKNIALAAFCAAVLLFIVGFLAGSSKSTTDTNEDAADSAEDEVTM